MNGAPKEINIEIIRGLAPNNEMTQLNFIYSKYVFNTRIAQPNNAYRRSLWSIDGFSHVTADVYICRKTHTTRVHTCMSFESIRTLNDVSVKSKITI